MTKPVDLLVLISKLFKQSEQVEKVELKETTPSSHEASG